MHCSSCDFDNPEGMKFCGGCGAALPNRCPQCGFDNPPQFRFCGQCGASLGAETAPATAASDAQQISPRAVAPAPPAAPRPEAERRQLTVMFCDLVGSTALSGRLDPEDLRDVIQGYQRACAEVIQRYDGYVAQLLGDGLLVYFGYPQAHEDDARRAIYAGLGMIQAMVALNHRLEGERGVRLAIRVGIHTGLVVIGDMGGEGRQEQLALGEAPNIAARIQGLAEPDTVLVSHGARQLAEGYVEYEMRGEHTLRGVAEPMRLYRVLRESHSQSRLDVAALRGLTPLVGRESETALLVDRWRQAQDGRGQVVLLSGEAGIGKSRLVQVLKDRVATAPHIAFECRSSPYYQNTALYPITDLLQHLMRWEAADDAEAKWRKLEETLGRYHVAVDEAAPLLAALLSLPLPENKYAPLDLTPQSQRQKTLETLVDLVVAASESQPLLFIVEDLHWTDPTTLEFLELLMNQSAAAAILTLLTSRPEFAPPWPHRTHLAEIALPRLSRPQMEHMIERVAHGKRLPDGVVRELIQKTDGVPLYLEEMTKAVVESGMLKERDDHYELTGSVSSLAIPVTLHDSLMARLDRLASAKGVAQLGAVIGRQFSYSLLRAVSPFDEDALQWALGQLIEAELIYQRGLPPLSTYTFKHALIQDTAYQSLLRRTRQAHHQRIAQALTEQFPDMTATQPELVAHHFTEAGLNQQAIDAWQGAGELASARSDYAEAEAHLRKGIELLQHQSESSERSQRELALQMALAESVAGKGTYTSDNLEIIYKRTHTLAQQVGDTTQLLSVLQLMRRYYTLRGEPQSARELCEELLALAQREQNSDLLQESHWGLGQTLFVLGEAAASRQHLEQSAAFYTPQPLISQASRDQAGTQIACLAFLAPLLWALGYPDKALTTSEEALHLAHELGHPYTLAFALYNAPWVYLFRYDFEDLEKYTDAMILLSTEHDFPNRIFLGQFQKEWIRAMRGEADSIMQMEQLVTSELDQLDSNSFTYLHLLTALTEACIPTRQVEAGLRIANQAHKLIEKTSIRRFEPHLFWSEGELSLMQAAQPDDAAERYFLQALDIARRQQVKSWELRAATSLARLWQSQGKRQEAYDLLAPVYAWFTEGFDTIHLIAAKALLDALEGSRS